MASAENAPALVADMPDLVDGKVEGPPWSDATRIYEGILDGGPAAVASVIDLLNEVDDGSDYKARYTLHGLLAYASRPAHDPRQKMLIATLLEAVHSDRPKPIRAFLLRQLEAAGDPSAASVLGDLLTDATLSAPAAQALLAIGEGAAAPFRKALDGATGRQRLTVVHALAWLRDRRAAAALKEAAKDGDRAVRIAAVHGLATLGEPTAADLVLRAAQQDGWERIQGAKACLLLGENLEAAGDGAAAKKVYRRLLNTRNDSEAYLRDILKDRL